VRCTSASDYLLLGEGWLAFKNEIKMAGAGEEKQSNESEQVLVK